MLSVWAGLGLVQAVGCNLSAWTCPVSFAEEGGKVRHLEQEKLSVSGSVL
jgi:hypothetical protein